MEAQPVAEVETKSSELSEEELKNLSINEHENIASADSKSDVPAAGSSVFVRSIAEISFTEGIMSFLTPVVTELDSRVRSTRQSQIELRRQIDLLAEDLRRISDEHQMPYELEPYVKKLSDAKKRVAVVTSILQNAQERLLKLHQTVVKETSKKKALLEQPTPNPPT